MDLLKQFLDFIRQFFIYSGQPNYFQFWWTIFVYSIPIVGILIGVLGFCGIGLMLVWKRLGELMRIIG